MFTIAVSPCSNPEFTLEEALKAYGEIGYSRFEVFTSWCKSALPQTPEEVACFIREANTRGFAYSGIHLPVIAGPSLLDALPAMVALAFGYGLGCRIAIVKGATRESLIAGADRLLNDLEGGPTIPVLQNHAGSAISTLDDYMHVLDGIGDDRVKCTLEVGHFHTVGVPWQEAYDALAGRIELVHVKDQIGPQSVPFGTGEIDLPGLFARLIEDGYQGDVVVEMEVEDTQNTLRYLADALAYVQRRR